jgi:hypothetical protein
LLHTTYLTGGEFDFHASFLLLDVIQYNGRHRAEDMASSSSMEYLTRRHTVQGPNSTRCAGTNSHLTEHVQLWVQHRPRRLLPQLECSAGVLFAFMASFGDEGRSGGDVGLKEY